jgi:hypothetical protein
MAEEIYFQKKPFNSLWNLIQPTINDFKNIVWNIWEHINNCDRLKSPIEFRKHLFNYIKWIKWNKEFKQWVVEYRDYYGLKNYIDQFFEKII